MVFLQEKKLYSVGTVRSNKKDLPKEMKKKQKLKRGEHKAFPKDKVAAIMWQDNRPVALLSTAHNPNEVVTVPRKGWQ